MHKSCGLGVLNFKPLKPHSFKVFLNFSRILRTQTGKVLYIYIFKLIIREFNQVEMSSLGR